MLKALRSAAIIFVAAAFLLNSIPYPFAIAGDISLPVPGVMVSLSPEFNPPVLKGIKIHPDNPFRFDFILDKGDSELSNDQIQDESSRLIKYFLASLTIPEKDLWVNLSPYEKNRVIPNSFGLTEMGRDLLAEDYMLKQITASLIYPEDKIGKIFWKRVYEEAAKKYGTTDVPVNTFNKVWIVPEKAVVYENSKAGTAYVVESKLKVMLEQDYLSLEKHSDPLALSQNDVNALGSRIVREIVIPELTKEVNENKNFAQLRQVYNSLILAAWYKKKIKDSILELVYADKNKIAGVQYDRSIIPTPAVILSAVEDLNRSKGRPQNDVEKIYQRYLQAFKKGAFNYIKEDLDSVTQEMIPRKYFSGGFNAAMITPTIEYGQASLVPQRLRGAEVIVADFEMARSGSSRFVADHIAISPDNNGTSIDMVIPQLLLKDPKTSRLIGQLKARVPDFAMTNDNNGHVGLSFKIKEQTAKIRSSLNFMPWERHATKILLGGTVIFSAVALLSPVPERAISVVDMMLVSFILMLELKERQEKRFIADHGYYQKVLKDFYKAGKFTNGHNTREVLSFYKSNYTEFTDNLDDEQEVETLMLLAGTLTKEDADILKRNKKKVRFEHRLEWALDELTARREEFIKVHETYLNQLKEADKDQRKVSSKVTTKALKFYNQNDQDFTVFLTKLQRDEIAQLLATHLSVVEKNRILTLKPKQRTAIQELMYWDLEVETAEEVEKTTRPENDSSAKGGGNPAMLNVGDIWMERYAVPLTAQNLYSIVKQYGDKTLHTRISGQFDVTYYRNLGIVAKSPKKKTNELEESINVAQNRLGGLAADFVVVDDGGKQVILQQLDQPLDEVLAGYSRKLKDLQPGEPGYQEAIQGIEQVWDLFFRAHDKMLNRGVKNWDMKLENLGKNGGDDGMVLDIGDLSDLRGKRLHDLEEARLLYGNNLAPDSMEMQIFERKAKEYGYDSPKAINDKIWFAAEKFTSGPANARDVPVNGLAHLASIILENDLQRKASAAMNSQAADSMDARDVSQGVKDITNGKFVKIGDQTLPALLVATALLAMDDKIRLEPEPLDKTNNFLLFIKLSDEHEKLLKPLLEKLNKVLGQNLEEGAVLAEKTYPEEGFKGFGVLIKRKDKGNKAARGVVSSWIDKTLLGKIYPASKGETIDLNAAMTSRVIKIEAAMEKLKFRAEKIGPADFNGLGLGELDDDVTYNFYSNPKDIISQIGLVGEDNVIFNGPKVDLRRLDANSHLHVLIFEKRPFEAYAVLFNAPAQTPTAAMLNGGIDLNPANMDLQTQNDNGEIKFHLDPAMLLQLKNAPGFYPKVISIQPLNDLQQFLGISAAKAL